MAKPDFTAVWGSTNAPFTAISDTDYKAGWVFRTGAPPRRVNFDYFQNLSDQRHAWLEETLESRTGQATELISGISRFGTQAEVDAGTLGDVAVTPKKMRWGFSISLTTNGYIVFPSWLGGWILQWLTATHTAGKNTLQTFSLPIQFLTAHFVSVALDSSTTESRPVIWSAESTGLTSVVLHWTFGDLSSGTTSRTCKIIAIGK